MKKLYTLSCLLLATLFYAQCNISGKNTINIGEQATYQIGSEAAQCRDCHLWTYAGQSISFVGDTRQNILSVSGVQPGAAVLSLTYLSSKGISTCSKNIQVLPSGATPSQSPNTGIDCDININNFKEVKVDNGIVSFFPTGNDGGFGYEWVALYADGSTQSSRDKVPQFNYSKDNSIIRISVKISSKICYKNLSKNYENTFWKVFK